MNKFFIFLAKESYSVYVRTWRMNLIGKYAIYLIAIPKTCNVKPWPLPKHAKVLRLLGFNFRRKRSLWNQRAENRWSQQRRAFLKLSFGGYLSRKMISGKMLKLECLYKTFSKWRSSFSSTSWKWCREGWIPTFCI